MQGNVILVDCGWILLWTVVSNITKSCPEVSKSVTIPCAVYLHALISHSYTMIWMLTCISAAHIYRLITDYGGYHLDFTG